MRVRHHGTVHVYLSGATAPVGGGVVNVDPMSIVCPCGCGMEGTTAKRNGHTRNCPPARCPSCRNGANRRKGQVRQREARKALGVPKTKQAGTLGNEEHWRGAFRVEVKAGQQVGPIATRFLLYEAQSEASRARDDLRPFAAVAMPDGMADGIVMVRLDVWRQHIAPMIEEA